MTAPVSQQQQLTAAQLAALLTLVQAQSAVRQRVTRTAVESALQVLRPFTGWWNDAEVDKAAARILRAVQPAQRQAAAVTDAYLTRVSSLMTGRRLTPAGAVDVTRLRTDVTPQIARDLLDGHIKSPWVVLGDTHDGPAPTVNAPAPMAIRTQTTSSATRTAPAATGGSRLRTLPPATLRREPGRSSVMAPAPAPPRPSVTPRPSGTPRQSTARTPTVDPVTPYRRIAEQYRYQVTAEGMSGDKAREQALVKLEIATQTDVTLAVREQYHRTMGKHKADGYRRILHPELSQTGPCGLCVVAANRVYRVADLLPLHSRCVCEVLPIYGRLDPGVYLNASDLRTLYQEAGGEQAPTTAGRALKKIEVAFADSPAVPAERAVRLRAQLDQLERSYETLVHRAMNGENLAKSMNAQAARITEIRDELGLGPSTVAPRISAPSPRGSNPMKKMRVALTENGEIGPVLVDASQRHRGPVDVAKTKVPDRNVRARAQLDALEKSFATLQQRQQHGENVDKALQWQADKITGLRRELGVPVG